jgi:hypothetical protein
MRCVSRELNATREADGIADNRCEWAQRRIDALQECAETQCTSDSRPLQARLEHWQEIIEEKLGDEDCDFSMDKLPFAKCARCALPYLALANVATGDAPCESIAEAAKGMTKCRKTHCVGDRLSLADGLEELEDAAGSTCALPEVTAMCGECLSDLKTLFESFKETAPTCSDVKDMGSELKDCAKMCKAKYLKRTGVKALLQSMARRIKGKGICSEEEEEEMISDFEAFATAEGFTIDANCDEAIEDCSAAPALSVALSAFAVVAAVSAVLA